MPISSTLEVCGDMSTTGRTGLSSAVLTMVGLVLVIPVLCTVISNSVVSASAFEPWWVQAAQETQLWSGPDNRAVSFGTVPQWSYFQVVAPQNGPRLQVLNPITRGYAYIDAAAVGPSTPPPPPTPTPTPIPQPPLLRTPPELPQGYVPDWVSNFVAADLWSGPDGDATSLGKIPPYRKMMVVVPQNGDRLRVWSPDNDSYGFVAAAAVGPCDPSIWMEARTPQVVRKIGLPARAAGDSAHARNLPAEADETEVKRLPNNSAVRVVEAVKSALDEKEWYKLEDGLYIRAEQVRLPGRPATPRQGRWIDADLSEPAMVTAYEGDRVVYTALAIKGFAATPTLRGNFQILYRVEKETMDSETIGIPRTGPGGYLLKDVLYTQYFTNDGASLHYNYWLGTFGNPGSHGCLGLNLEDARWFWDWASVGTPVVIR
jgi:lipoprotein-anchoring transpeptidase ErfK/SrfK